MKKYYQIVYQVISTGQFLVLNRLNFKQYEDALKELRKDKNIAILHLWSVYFSC